MAHEAASKGDCETMAEIEKEVDSWAGKMWGLNDHELAEIQRSLEEA